MAFYKHNKTNTVADDPILGPEWHPTKNQGIDPHTLTTGSEKRVYWLCYKGHEWKARINRRGKCPICDGRVVTLENCLSTTNPELVKEWVVEENKEITPEDVTNKSIRKVSWKCPKGHIYQAKIYLRISGQGCSYCAGKLVAENDSLAAKYPQVAAEWYQPKNGKLTPKDVLPKSSHKIWWKCENGHIWKTEISKRTATRIKGPYTYHGTGCPICSRLHIKKI